MFSFLSQIWDSFIKACEDIGMELVKDGAIVLDDMDAWKQSKNKIVNIGIPAYAILECLLYSIKSGCNGFIMRKYCHTLTPTYT